MSFILVFDLAWVKRQKDDGVGLPLVTGYSHFIRSGGGKEGGHSQLWALTPFGNGFLAQIPSSGGMGICRSHLASHPMIGAYPSFVRLDWQAGRIVCQYAPNLDHDLSSLLTYSGSWGKKRDGWRRP